MRKKKKIIELHNAKIYYKVNWVILWDRSSKRVYWRNTWTGREKFLGTAKTLKEAKEIKNQYLAGVISGIPYLRCSNEKFTEKTILGYREGDIVVDETGIKHKIVAITDEFVNLTTLPDHAPKITSMVKKEIFEKEFGLCGLV